MYRIMNNKKNKFRYKGKLRYTSKNFSNPFFIKKKRKKIKKIKPVFSLKIKIIFIALTSVIFIAAWFCLFSSHFIIKELIINGGGNIEKSDIEKIVNEQIDGKIFFLIPQNNIFLLSDNILSNKLQEKYAFNSLEIIKHYPEKLEIKYIEKKYAIIWQEDDLFYYTDKSGYVINEANVLEIENKDYPIIVNQTNNKIYQNQVFADQSLLEKVVELFKKMKYYEKIFKVENFILDNDLNTIKIKIENGPLLYVNTQENLDKQIDKVLIIKEEKLGDDFFKKYYIDVRYGESVYYR